MYGVHVGSQPNDGNNNRTFVWCIVERVANCLFVWVVIRSIGYSLVRLTPTICCHSKLTIQLNNCELNSPNNQADCLLLSAHAIEYAYFSLFSAVFVHFFFFSYPLTGPNKKDHAKRRRSGKSGASRTDHNLYPFLKKILQQITMHRIFTLRTIRYGGMYVAIQTLSNNWCVCLSVCLPVCGCFHVS